MDKTINKFDIGQFVNVNTTLMEDKLKHKLLKEPWIPEEGFTFPVSEKRNLKFQRSWFKKFPWLTYTQCNGEGALCKLCVLFRAEYGGKGHNQKLLSFVSSPFTNWKKAIEKFTEHAQNKYHLENVVKADNFLGVYTKDIPDIRNTLDASRQKSITDNRKRLSAIIDVIKLCGRQELALRGTKDSGHIDFDKTEPTVNDGNFRAILRMRVSDDINLAQLFNSAPRNALYISPKIQNELIKICGDVIQQHLCEKINNSKCFSILADETTDISGIEQMSLCIRYTEKVSNELVIREDFLTYVPLQETTGEAISSKILETLNSLNLNTSYLFGQGYDGAGAMSGRFNGVQKLIRDKFPAAFYIHCSAHSLNLAICHASQVQHIRNCFGTIKSINTFMKKSAKRQHILQQKIKENTQEVHWRKLTSMCDTRWVENHDGLLRFKEIILPIVLALEELSLVTNMETSSKATQFLKSITSAEFVISICTAEVVFKHTISLCKCLQKVDCDLISAMDLVDNIYMVISDMRTNMDTCFARIFNEASSLLKTINGEIKIPRLVSIQTKRCNVNVDSPEEYFRIAIAIPFFDDFLDQIKTRFTDHRQTVIGLQKLIPKYCLTHTFTEVDIASLIEHYSNIIDEDTLEAEIKLWQNKWKFCDPKSESLPANALGALNECNEDIYPSVFALLKVLATLPVSTATSERSFSTLRRLKTYLRNSTSEDRMTGLALMSVHREINIPNEKVLDLFSTGTRKLDFVI